MTVNFTGYPYALRNNALELASCPGVPRRPGIMHSLQYQVQSLMVLYIMESGHQLRDALRVLPVGMANLVAVMLFDRGCCEVS